MNRIAFGLAVSHVQVSVFDLSFADFPIWTDADVARGFVSHQSHVAIGLPDCVAVHVIFALHGGALSSDRANEVPLHARSDRIMIASVPDERELNVRPGSYLLRFEITDHAAEIPTMRLDLAPLGQGGSGHVPI